MKKKSNHTKFSGSLTAITVMLILTIFSCKSTKQSTESFQFGGTDQIMNVGVDHSKRDQEILIGVLRARWSPNSGDFNTFEPQVAAAFDRMNDFWDEASFGMVSFNKNYLTTSIIDVPKSMDYYYHPFQQRTINSSAVADVIDLPSNKDLTIKSDGEDVTITFSIGATNRADVVSIVNAAIATTMAAHPSAKTPTFKFTDNAVPFGPKTFTVKTTLLGEAKAKIELSGDAMPFLGFGASSLYNLGDDAPPKIIFSKTVTGAIDFPSAMQLEISTLGTNTIASFAPGNTNVNDVVNTIRSAYPGDPVQQPFTVEAINDPVDAGKKIFVFKSNVSADGDNGIKLVVSGSAAALLGLDINNAGVIYRYEPKTLRGFESITEGFNAYASTLPAGTDMNAVFGNAKMFTSVFVDDFQFRAHYSKATFNIHGTNFDVDYFASSITDDPGRVFAHETGHALSFPDLYPEPGSGLIGNQPRKWDVMDCSRCDPHPVTWLKSFHHQDAATRANTWIDDSHIEVVPPVPAGNIPTRTFLLTPGESPFASPNPFLATHPTIKMVHGIELVPTDPKEVYFIENRQKGMYHGDNLGAQVDFSTDIPSEGVIFYQARRVDAMGLASFLPVNLLSVYANPLNAVNEELEFPITASNKVKIKILEKLTNPNTSGTGNTSYSYVVQVDWGEGSFYDLSITPWNPPPYESPDIWVDNNVQNDWGVYTFHDASGNPVDIGDNVAVNNLNKLYAKVSNIGDIPITQNITVIWRIAIPQMAGGNIITELGRVTIPGGVPANSSVITPPLEWRPSEDNNGHVCIKAEIVPVPGERNETLNNMAQENITHWFSGASSPFKPVTFTFQTKNPYDDREIDIRINVPRVPRGWTVNIEDVSFRLKPGEVKKQTATITPNLAYFQSTPGFRERQLIASFTANIQALTPIGDQWLPIGGISAVVDPVNEKAGIKLQAFRETRSLVVVDCILSTSGPLNPPLANREIHVRFEDDKGNQLWKQALTDASGHIHFSINVSDPNSSYKIQSFFGGGGGINASISNIINVK